MLDLRLPIGIFFLIIGAVLIGDGIVKPVNAGSVAIDIDLVWGACLFVFGAIMAVFGWGAQKVIDETEAEADAKKQ